MGTEGMQSRAGFSPPGRRTLSHAERGGEGGGDRSGNGGDRSRILRGGVISHVALSHRVVPAFRVPAPLISDIPVISDKCGDGSSVRTDAVLQGIILRNASRRSETLRNNGASRTRRNGGVSDSVGQRLCEWNFARRCSHSARYRFPNRLRKPGKLSDLCGSGRAARTNVRKRSPVHFSGLRILSVHTSPNPGRIEAFGARRGTERKTRREEIPGASLPLSLRPSSTKPPCKPPVSDGRD